MSPWLRFAALGLGAVVLSGCGSPPEMIFTVTGAVSGAQTLHVLILEADGLHAKEYRTGTAEAPITLPATVSVRSRESAIGLVVWISNGADSVMAAGISDACVDPAVKEHTAPVVALRPVASDWSPQKLSTCHCAAADTPPACGGGETAIDGGTSAADGAAPDARPLVDNREPDAPLAKDAERDQSLGIDAAPPPPPPPPPPIDAGVDAAPPPDLAPINPPPDPPVDARAPNPRTIVFSDPMSSTAIVGSPNGSLLIDTCPAGQVLVGFQGSSQGGTGANTQIGGLCSTLDFFDSKLRFTPAPPLVVHGPDSGVPWTRTCPAGSVVVGFSGRASSIVDQLTFLCSVVTTSNGAATVKVNVTRILLGTVGGPGGTSFPETLCASGQAAVSVKVRAPGDVTAFGLGCATPLFAN